MIRYRKRFRERKTHIENENNDPINYKFNVNLYDTPPNSQESLFNLEEICIERLQLYNIITNITNMQKPYSPPWCELIEKELQEKCLVNFLVLLDIYKNDELSASEWSCLQQRAREIDHVGNYMLSMVFCNDIQTLLFYLQCEIKWFKLRYGKLSENTKKEFLKQNKFDYQEIPTEEKDMHKDELINNLNIDCIETAKIHKIKFQKGYKLVETKKILMSKGDVYFSSNDIFLLVESKFEHVLSKRLSLFNSSLQDIADERVKRLIKHFWPACLSVCTKSYSIEHNNSLSIRTINEQAKTYFPLCMEHLHEVLMQKHHLKFFARKQYSIFLKNAGMPFEDAMAFFRIHFTENMTEDDFVKRRYDYYFRHVYGKVGNKFNYRCNSCSSIFLNGVPMNREHGCPFVTFDNDHLYNKLQQKNFHIADIEDIMSSKNEKQYKQCCLKYYALTQKDAEELKFLNSPNQYYAAAVQRHNARMLIVGKHELDDIFISEE